MPNIDKYSTIALYITMYHQDTVLSNGTAFAVKKGDTYYLITNWHNVTGRNFFNNSLMSPTAAIPDRIKVLFHGDRLGEDWDEKEIMLLNDEEPLWLEWPNGRADVVAIPFIPEPDVKIYDLDLGLAEFDLSIYPSEPVSIIGYPEGLMAHAMFPIWKTAHIASDIDLDWVDFPAFLVDGNTRKGMSGSPAIAKRVSIYQNSGGNQIGNAVKFLGVYSGRLHKQAGIGIVWKPRVITEILESL